jgi:hypothetical protein
MQNTPQKITKKSPKKMQKEKMTHGAHDPKMAILGLEPPRRKIWALYSEHNITDGHRQF